MNCYVEDNLIYLDSTKTTLRWCFANAETINIPASVDTIISDAFRYSTSLDTIVLNQTTPPSISSISYLDTGIHIYVPCIALAAYQRNAKWGKFSNYHVYGRVDRNESQQTCQAFNWIDGNTYTADTVVTYRYPDAVCDSTVTLILTVNATKETVLYDTICQGSDYASYGFTIENVQVNDTLTQELATVNGCDSTVTLMLTVNPTKETVLYDTICQGSDYANYGFTIENVQVNDTLTQELATVHGCDSTVTLILTVNATKETVLYDTICQGSDYASYGFSITNVQVNDTLTQELATVLGCDSTVTLTLTVYPIQETIFYDTICQGGDYDGYGFSVSSVRNSDTLTQHLTTASGCDSTVTLILTMTPAITNIIYDTLCHGDDYSAYGFTRYNVQQDCALLAMGYTAQGCDSVTLVSLRVFPHVETVLYDTVCRGSDYAEYGFALTNVQADDTLTQSLHTIQGCDSTVTLILTVALPTETLLIDAVCQGGDYTDYGFLAENVQQSDTLIQSLYTVHGCDSTVTLRLTMNPSAETLLYSDICQGADFAWGGFLAENVQQSDTLMQTLRTTQGCDSTVTLILTMNATAETLLYDTICQGNDYTAYGFLAENVQQSDTLTQTLRTTQGCDSTVTLRLTMNTTVETMIYDTVCQGDDYAKYGFALTNAQESTVLTQSHHTMQGCDSTVTLWLTVNPVYRHNDVVALCENMFPYHYGDSTLQAVGVHTIGFSTTNGCDSVITLSLMLKPSYLHSDVATICADILPYTYGDSVLTEGGLHRVTFTAENGCDSTVMLGLTVSPIYHTELYAGVPQGGSYMENGFDLYDVQRDSSYTQTLQSHTGCDSTVTLHVTMYTHEETYIEAAICAGDNYTENGFVLLNQQTSGLHTLNLQTTHGSDSTVYLNLTVLPNKVSTLQAILCQGSDYMEYGFSLSNVQESDTVERLLASAQGCDSTVRLALTVKPIYSHTASVELCDNSLPYTYGDTTLYSMGLHTIGYTAANGCDSVLTLNLQHKPSYYEADAATICADMLPYTYGDSVLTEGGFHNITFVAENGCDSTIMLALTVNDTFHIVLNDTVARGMSYMNYGFLLCNVRESGSYTQELTTLYGCDSIVTLNLVVQNVGIETIANGEEIAVVLYPNPADERVTLQVQALPSDAEVTIYDAQGRAMLSQTLKAGQEELTLNISHLAAGSYHVRIVTDNKAVVRKLIVR